MRRALLILSCFLLTALAGAQTPACLKVSCIPDSLKKGAHAVTRLDESTVTYQSAGKYRESIHQIVTVLDDSGTRHFRQVFPVERFHKVVEVDVRILDANGLEVRRYGRRDFEVITYDDGFSLATDAAYIRLDPMHPPLPCTIEVRVESEVSSSISPPSWSFVQKGTSVENSRFSLSLPAGLELLYKRENGAGEPVATSEKGWRTYVWTARNLSALGVLDPASGKRRYPMVELSVTPFQYGGYNGDIRNWRTLGKWFYDLFQEPGEPFAPARKEEIKAMFRSAGSSRQVIDSLYRYMQRNMRYVSIQLGIGGFKPFPVSFVDQKKYGDCKALTNYMRYLLREAGIKSYPALINAGEGEEPIDTSFASSPFNHVILCVPFQGGDTVWLECTSKFTQPGVLGSFTENRYALLLKEDGGHIVSTPRSAASGNILSTSMVIDMDADGSGKGELRMLCQGDFQQEYLEYRAKATREQWKKFMLDETGLKDPDAFVITEPRPLYGEQALIRVAYEKLPLVNSGNKMFLPLRLVNLAPGSVLAPTDHKASKPYTRRDTTIYVLPKGARPQSLPAEQQINTPFGSFRTAYNFDETDSRLILTAELSLLQPDPGHSNPALWDGFLKALREEPAKLLVILRD